MASSRCDYTNHNGIPCPKSAKFRYEFSGGKIYHCCGNRHHCDMIVSKMDLDESIYVFVYEQISEQFIESHTLNCFNIVFASKIFQGPYTEKETYLLQLKKQSMQYSKDLMKYMNTLETMKNLKEEATTLRLTLESPFLSISEEEYEEIVEEPELEENTVEKIRVCMMGDNGVGKTALVSQFLTSDYIDTYDASLGKLFCRFLTF